MRFQAWYQYLSTAEKRAAALSLHIRSDTLRQINNGHRRPSPALTLALEKYTDGALSRHNLRPDVYPVRGCQCENCAANSTASPESGVFQSLHLG